MGCGSSKTTSTSPSQHMLSDHNGIPATCEKNHCASASKLAANGVTQPSMEIKRINNNNEISEEHHRHQLTPNGAKKTTDQEIKENLPATSEVDSGNPARKEKKHPTNAVAFEVKLEENTSLRQLRRPPKLQKLDHLPILTAEMLAKKLALAEENRQKEIQKKLSKTSKRKKQLLEARELDKAEEKRLQMETKLNAQNMKRAKFQAEIVEKQRRRELRAKRVRDKAQKIREGDDIVQFELDPDETYNADEEDDGWDIQPAHEHHKSSENSMLSNTHVHSTPTIDSDDEQPQDPTSVHDFFEE